MFFSYDDAPIIAQCTPRGSGALALLRVSGCGIFSLVDRFGLLGSGKTLSTVQSHTVHYGWVLDREKNKIDQVMFLVMHGPKTFTGQDTVEITCHNNQFIVDAIIESAITCGIRIADNGEFTRRAVLNGKIDLIQAEAINELIHAQTQLVLKKSLSVLSGSFSQWIEHISKELLKAFALSEASFEFLDEEISFVPQIKTILEQVLVDIAEVKKTFNQQQQIRQGVRIALIGSVNAGKSSLFNALIGAHRAIVTDIPGTTRDSIEAGLYKNGNYWTLVDTAGLRQADDCIEKEGIQRSLEQAHLADIILLVFDGARLLNEQEALVYQDVQEKYGHKIITVQNKSDLTILHDVRKPAMDSVFSNQIKELVALLENLIAQKIKLLFAQAESPFLLNQRHHHLLLHLEKNIQEIMHMVHADVQYELLSYHLNEANALLCQLTGKSMSEAGMDAIFKEFCVGK